MDDGLTLEGVTAEIERQLAARGDYREKVRRTVASYPLVAFYGCGAILDSIVETWDEQVGRRIDLCCDSDPSKWGREFAGGIRCVSPDELRSIKERCAVFVTIGQFREVFDALVEAGFPSVNLIFKYDLVAAEFLDSRDDAETAAELAAARSLLADDRSREVFDAILRRVLGEWNDPGLMPSVCDPDQYFPSDLVSLGADEAFVDVGAYDGDTVRDIVSRTGGRFERITCFELDRLNYEALSRNLRTMPQADRITARNLGLWDTAADVRYSVGRSQSTIGSDGEVGHVVPLDEVLVGERVTFIKMDIEGAEPQALNGARSIITAQRPKLAVCVYHHISHLWDIPLAIHDLDPRYRLYLRHHTNLEYETVCYALP